MVYGLWAMGYALGGKGSILSGDKKLLPSPQCSDRLILFSGVKQPEREAYHSPSSSAELKNCGSIPPLHRMSQLITKRSLSWPPLWSSGQSSWLQNGDVLCFLWGTNWIYICYVEESRSPLWSSGQSCWPQIHRSVFDSRRYQIFWEVVSLERGPLSLVSTIEELLGRKSSGSGLESREYGRRDPSRDTQQKLALSSLISGCRSVGIVRSRTQATEVFFSVRSLPLHYCFCSRKQTWIALHRHLGTTFHKRSYAFCMYL
jgi:hypothetical protein